MKRLYKSLFSLSSFNLDIYPKITYLTGICKKYKSALKKKIPGALIKTERYTWIKCYQFNHKPWNAHINKSRILKELFKYYIKFVLICSISDMVYVDIFYNNTKDTFKSIKSEHEYFIDDLYLIFTDRYDYNNNDFYRNIYECFFEGCIKIFIKTEYLKEFNIEL